MIGTTATRYQNSDDSASAKTGQVDPLSLQQEVSKRMAAAHGISFELARYHVSQMNEAELADRYRRYAGVELSGARRNQQSGSDFYQVFGSATATARLTLLNPVPVFRPKGAGTSLPELEEKTWSDGGGGR